MEELLATKVFRWEDKQLTIGIILEIVTYFSLEISVVAYSYGLSKDSSWRKSAISEEVGISGLLLSHIKIWLITVKSSQKTLNHLEGGVPSSSHIKDQFLHFTLWYTTLSLNFPKLIGVYYTVLNVDYYFSYFLDYGIYFRGR